VIAALSIIVSTVALTVSAVALWQTHFSPFSPLVVGEQLTLSIYPIRSGSDRWFIVSLVAPISITNEGARPGVISGLRLRLHYPNLPIPDNREFIYPVFEIKGEEVNKSSRDRFEWIDKNTSHWMPFTILPKATATKHLVFERRWEKPVVQPS